MRSIRIGLYTSLIVFMLSISIGLTAIHSESGGSIPWCGSILAEPRWGAPEAVLSGKSFVIELSKSLELDKAVITNGSASIELELKKLSDRRYVATVPSDAASGIYDLVLYSSGKALCSEHNAVWVLKSYPKKLVLMHITDTHFGVINPTGRSATSYVLATVIIANSIPNLTAIIATGDIADTASVDQYQEARTILGMLTKPIFIAPGNHDHVTGEKNFIDYIGPLRWVRTLGSYLIVTIDSGYEGYITSEQAQWVYNVLTKSNASFDIVLVHHPLFSYVYGETPHSFKASDWKQLLEILESKKPGSKYPYIYTSWLENREALAKLVQAIYDSRIGLVLAGHIHLDSYAEVTRNDGSKIYFVVSTALGGPVRTGDYHGFRILVVNPDGTVNVYGFGKPWDRHASYSVEGIETHLTESSNAIAVSITISDSKIASMLPHLVLSVPVPSTMTNYSVYAPGAEKVWKRCGPSFCAIYALEPKVEVNKTYRIAVYTKPDREPPKIEITEAPSSIEIGEPITISYRVSDDSWGIEKSYVVIEYGGKKLVATPAQYGNIYRLTLPPLSQPTTVKMTIYAVDASGKISEKSLTIRVVAPTTTSPVTSVTKTTTSVATSTTIVRTTTTVSISPVTISVSIPSITVSIKPITITTRAPALPTALFLTIAVAAVIGIVLFVILSRRS